MNLLYGLDYKPHWDTPEREQRIMCWEDGEDCLKADPTSENPMYAHCLKIGHNTRTLSPPRRGWDDQQTLDERVEHARQSLKQIRKRIQIIRKREAAKNQSYTASQR